MSRCFIPLLAICMSSVASSSHANQMMNTADPCEYPTVTISNKLANLLVLLPDAEKGYYRSSRFDWSGMIAQATYKGHTYFQEWEGFDFTPEFRHHDPLTVATGTGNCEEFRLPLRYDDAPPGGRFVKIGVGILEKPQGNEDYLFSTAYKLLDSGQWSVTNGQNWVEFEHRLSTDFGYEYRYIKRIELMPGTSEILVHHRLENTGSKKIISNTYSHNFMRLDKTFIGKDYTITYPQRIKAVTDLGPWAVIGENTVGFSADLTDGKKASGTLDVGSTHHITISNRKTGTAVVIKGNRPILDCYVWAWQFAICTEPMIDVVVPPAESFEWEYTYTLSAP